MIRQRQSKREKEANSLIQEALSGGLGTDRFMNSWLEKISVEDMTLLWRTLKESAKVARRHTLWVRTASGITVRADYQAGAIVSITVNGFAIRLMSAKPVSPSTTERGR